MAGRVQELERPAGELEPLAIARDEDARGVDRRDLAVEPAVAGLAVDTDRRRDQHRGIDEVRGAARMQHGLSPRQFAQQRAGAAGVVEVDVGQEQPVDRVTLDAESLERGEHVRRRQRGATVDDRGPAAVRDHVDRVEAPLARSGHRPR